MIVLPDQPAISKDASDQSLAYAPELVKKKPWAALSAAEAGTN
jgi:hypothetical protein